MCVCVCVCGLYCVGICKSFRYLHVKVNRHVQEFGVGVCACTNIGERQEARQRSVIYAGVTGRGRAAGTYKNSHFPALLL